MKSIDFEHEIITGNIEKLRNSVDQQLPAIFLDRDGVIIEDVHYIKHPSEVSLEKGIDTLFKAAYKAKWPIIIVTNQSGISRGIITWDDYIKVTNEMIRLLGLPSPLSAIYANSYLINLNDENSRKPSPKMLFKAAKKLNIDLSRSLIVGDRNSDLIAGALAGVKNVMHVLSGHGIEERELILSNKSINGRYLVKDKSPNLFLLNTLNDFPYEIL